MRLRRGADDAGTREGADALPATAGATAATRNGGVPRLPGAVHRSAAAGERTGPRTRARHVSAHALDPDAARLRIRDDDRAPAAASAAGKTCAAGTGISQLVVSCQLSV